MRLQAFSGGLALLIGVAFWSASFDGDRGVRPSEVSTCSIAAEHDFCDAVAALSTALRHPLLRMDATGVLPPRDIPGAVDPAITQANIDTTIRRPG